MFMFGGEAYCFADWLPSPPALGVAAPTLTGVGLPMGLAVPMAVGVGGAVGVAWDRQPEASRAKTRRINGIDRRICILFVDGIGSTALEGGLAERT